MAAGDKEIERNLDGGRNYRGPWIYDSVLSSAHKYYGLSLLLAPARFSGRNIPFLHIWSCWPHNIRCCVSVSRVYVKKKNVDRPIYHRLSSSRRLTSLSSGGHSLIFVAVRLNFVIKCSCDSVDSGKKSIVSFNRWIGAVFWIEAAWCLLRKTNEPIKFSRIYIFSF